MSEPPHDPQLTAVERALAGLEPSAGGFNRDALMFAAGQRSLRRGWAWPSAAAGSTLAAVILGALLLFRPTPERVVVVVQGPPPGKVETPPSPPEEGPAPVEASPAPKATPSRPETDYLTLRHQVERWGDAGLPAAPLSSAEDRRPRPDDPFDLPPDVRADPWLQRRTALLTSGGSL